MRQEPRWKHRFESFERAFRLLTEGLEKDELNDLETAGLTRMFGITFELAWKTLSDRLEHDDINVVATPRQVIRHAFGVGMIDDVQTWLNMLEDRSKMSHECDLEDFRVLETNIRDSHWVMLERFRNQFATDSHAKSTMKAEKTLVIADKTLAMMQDVFAQYPDLQKVTLFGSRAIGDATERSDIDLVTHGSKTDSLSRGSNWTSKNCQSRRSAKCKPTNESKPNRLSDISTRMASWSTTEIPPRKMRQPASVPKRNPRFDLAQLHGRAITNLCKCYR